MTHEHGPPDRVAAGRRLLAYVTAPGVVWWGLPTAIAFAVWMHSRAAGFSWAGLLSVEFLMWLVVSVVFIGLLGGNAFGRAMGRAGMPLARPRRKSGEPPA